jgi:hypothetical protein
VGERKPYLFGSQQCHADSDPTTLTSPQHEHLAILGKAAFLLESFNDLQVHNGSVPVGPVFDLAPRLAVT